MSQKSRDIALVDRVKSSRLQLAMYAGMTPKKTETGTPQPTGAIAAPTTQSIDAGVPQEVQSINQSHLSQQVCSSGHEVTKSPSWHTTDHIKKTTHQHVCGLLSSRCQGVSKRGFTQKKTRKLQEAEVVAIVRVLHAINGPSVTHRDRLLCCTNLSSQTADINPGCVDATPSFCSLLCALWRCDADNLVQHENSRTQTGEDAEGQPLNMNFLEKHFHGNPARMTLETCAASLSRSEMDAPISTDTHHPTPRLRPSRPGHERRVATLRLES